MDESSAETTHDLLLDLAGRVDDDLLAWARELVAVGETQHAFELISATLVADRAELPGPTRDALVAATRSVRTELDVDGALAPPATVDGGTGHRFDPGPAPKLVAAVRGLPARLLVGCRVLVTRRLTPAGSAPGPLPHPLVLVEVSPGARNRDVLAYQLADALDRAGVRASVEVITADRQLPAYHVAALRDAQPVPRGGPDGPGRDGATDPPAADRRPGSRPQPARGTPTPEPAPRPVPLRAGGERAEAAAEHVHDRVEPTGSASAGSEPSPAAAHRTESEVAGSDRAGSDRAGSDRAGLNATGLDRAGSDRTGSDRTGSDRTGSDRAGADQAGSDGGPESEEVPADRPAAGPARSDLARSDLARSDLARSDLARSDLARSDLARSDLARSDLARSDLARSDLARSDLAASDPARSDLGRSDPARPDLARLGPNRPERVQPDPAGFDAVQPELARSERAAFDPARSEPAELDPARPVLARSERAGFDPDRSDPAGFDRDVFGGAGFNQVGFDRNGFDRDGSATVGSDGVVVIGPDHPGTSPAVQRGEAATESRPGPRPIPADRAPRPLPVRLPRREPGPAVRLVPDGGPDAGPGDEDHRSSQPERDSQPALAELGDRRPPESDDTAPASGPPDRPGPAEPTRERRHRYLFEQDTAGGHGSEPGPPIRSQSGNTEPLPIRTPLDRRDPGTARDRSATSREPGPPVGPAASGELGLRPESVARLSESGRELLARLQAELQGAPQLAPRAGGLSPNGGGNGTGPQAKVDPPNLAG